MNQGYVSDGRSRRLSTVSQGHQGHQVHHQTAPSVVMIPHPGGATAVINDGNMSEYSHRVGRPMMNQQVYHHRPEYATNHRYQL